MDDSSANPGDPETHTGPERGGSSLWFVWTFVLLFMVYPLSTGPAMRLYQNHPASLPALQIVYKPLDILVMNSGPAGDFFHWYIEKVWKYNPNYTLPPTARTNSAPAGK